ncbi:armadillo-type protein [Naematelia encephala]|uniref:Armadillo-type protein n=1 Tax=Naematelia encephala TaxID=71784 RepID=A0A1Y2BIK1_9TREE|nr:armadillo-type protein [Naematelia encephala]
MDQHVVGCLQATLSPDEGTRRQAEDELRWLFRASDGGLSLARIMLSPEVALDQRQMILLSKYIPQHWSRLSNTFEEPITPLEIKAQIRPLVFSGLSDSQSKIRSASAFALSLIARYDWPEEYPDLLDNLVGLLAHGSPDSVHGAMRVVAEFVKNDLSEDQLLPVVRDLLPALLNILGNPQLHSPSTRASAVNVFRQVVKMLEIVKDEHPQAVRQALEQIGAVWFSALQQLLATDAALELSQSWESIGIRLEIFRTLTFFQNSFPKLLTSSLPTYLRLSIQNLAALLPSFQTYYLSTDPSAPEPPSSTADVGFVAPKMDLDDLACAVFDFLTPVVRSAKLADILVQNEKAGEEMLSLIDLEEEWLDDLNAFIQDEDEETDLYALRTEGHDLVGSLIDKFPRPVAEALQALTLRRVEESAQARQAGQADWWKPLEAVLALLGGIADDIRNLLEENKAAQRPKSFDVQYLFDNVIPGLLDRSGDADTPFLQGRAFVFASQYSSLLPEPLKIKYLATAVSALESAEISVPVKIQAVLTIKNFCRHIDASVLKPQTGKILSLLIPLLPQTSSETLYLVLETIRATLSLDKELLTPESIPQLSERVYETWLTHSTDPVCTAIIEELFESLSSLPQPVITSLINHLSPKIALAISTPVTDETVHLPSEAIQLANSLLLGRSGPLEASLIGDVTTAVLGVLVGTDDMDTIQHGMIHLTHILTHCRRDAEGNNGIVAIFHLLARFLAPNFSESGGIFVGELIMHLFRKAGPTMGPVLPDLLRAVVQRLATAEMPSFIQSLVLPFAYLFGTEHTVSTVDLLSSFEVDVSSAGRKSGLEIVLLAWGETSDTITGSWNIRVSDLGMAKLFTLADERLNRVIVRGDLIISETNRNSKSISAIMTRSRTKISPNQYTQIPFPLKALKLLLKDVQNVGSKGGGGGKGKGKGKDVELDEDDGDDEWDDDDDPLGDTNAVGEFDYLSSWIDEAGVGAGAESDAQDDDADLKSDPIAQIDLGQHLSDTLRACYTSNINGIHGMIEGLTDLEKGILKGVLTL